MDATETYRRRPDLIARHIAGETLLVPLAGKIADLQRVIALNATGALIWEKLETPRNLDGIVAALVAAFSVDADTARRDATEFLERLESANLLETVV